MNATHQTQKPDPLAQIFKQRQSLRKLEGQLEKKLRRTCVSAICIGQVAAFRRLARVADCILAAAEGLSSPGGVSAGGRERMSRATARAMQDEKKAASAVSSSIRSSPTHAEKIFQASM